MTRHTCLALALPLLALAAACGPGGAPEESPTEAQGTPTATASGTPTAETPTPLDTTPTAVNQDLILYTDAGDQQIPVGSVFELDINGDDLTDLTLAYATIEGDPDILRTLSASPGALAQILLTLSGDAAPLSAGEIIGETPGAGSFSESEGELAAQTKDGENPGPWTGTFVGSGAYLGLAFLASGNTHHAWVEVSVDGASGDLTLGGYAYNLAPDRDIEAGQEE